MNRRNFLKLFGSAAIAGPAVVAVVAESAPAQRCLGQLGATHVNVGEPIGDFVFRGVPVDTGMARGSWTGGERCYGNPCGPNVVWDGEVGEVLYFDRPLDDEERDQVQGYLAKEWGL